MLVVVTVDFSMTLKAGWNSVLDVIVAGGVSLRNNVIQLDLHSAIPMTNTATAVTPNKQVISVDLIEFPHNMAYSRFSLRPETPST
jgi:hypothetical protein